MDGSENDTLYKYLDERFENSKLQSDNIRLSLDNLAANVRESNAGLKKEIDHNRSDSEQKFVGVHRLIEEDRANIRTNATNIESLRQTDARQAGAETQRNWLLGIIVTALAGLGGLFGGVFNGWFHH